MLIRLVIGLLLLFPSLAIAEDNKFQLDSKNYITSDISPVRKFHLLLALINDLSKDLSTPVTKSADGSHGAYHKSFYHGLSLVYEEKFVEAGEVFTKLAQDSHQEGYRNLTSYSYVLIDIARRFYQEGKESQAKYLIKYAILMSPEDGRVHFAAMPYAGEDESGSLLGFISKGVALLSRYPSVFLPFAANGLLVGLAALSLAFVLTCIVQIALHHKIIHKMLFRHFPRSVQLWVAPALLLVVLVAPMFLGILPTIVVWSAVISLTLSHGRWLPVLCCVLAISWGLGLKVISVTNQNVQTRINHSLENVSSGNFVAQDFSLIKNFGEQQQYSPHVVFARGLIHYFQGNYQKAIKYFETVSKIANNDPSLRAAALGNVAVATYRLGDTDSAIKLLEAAKSAGVGEFEYLKNVSLLQTMSADITAHRETYLKLKSGYAKRLALVETREGDNIAPLLFLLPAGDFIKSFFEPPIEQREREVLAVREAKVADLLLVGSTTEEIVVFGVVLLLVFIPLAFREKLNRFLGLYAKVEKSRSKQLLCFFLPGGGFISGGNPVLGMAILSAVLLCVMIHSGVPIKFFSVLPFPIDSGSSLLVIATFLFILGALLPLLQINLERRRIK